MMIHCSSFLLGSQEKCYSVLVMERTAPAFAAPLRGVPGGGLGGHLLRRIDDAPHRANCPGVSVDRFQPLA